MAHDIFISYSSKDKPTADAICHVLESNKLKCWIAPRNIIAGKNYAAQIMYGLKKAKIVVLVFSKNSQESVFVNNEIDTAFSNNKPIISFKIDETFPEKKMEFFLKNKHWLDAYPNPENVFERLVHDAHLLCEEERRDDDDDDDDFEQAFLDDDTASKHRTYPHLSSAHNDVFDDGSSKDDVESEDFVDVSSKEGPSHDVSAYPHLSSTKKEDVVDDSPVVEDVVEEVVDSPVVEDVVEEVVDSPVEKVIETKEVKKPAYQQKLDDSQQGNSFSKLKIPIIIAIVAIVAIVGVMAFGGIGGDNTSTADLIDIDYIEIDDDRDSGYSSDYSCFVMGSISSDIEDSSDYVVHTDFLDKSDKVVVSNETKLKDISGNILGIGFVDKNNIVKVSVELRDVDGKVISTAESENIQ